MHRAEQHTSGAQWKGVLICTILLLTAAGRVCGAGDSVPPPGEPNTATATSQDTTRKPGSAMPGSGEATATEVGADWMYQPDGASGAEGDDLTDFSLPALLLKVALGLGFVVLLAWGSVFLLKKSPLGRELSSVGSGIRVLERKYLAPKRAIYLVEMGNRALALGVTDQSITVLSRWRAGELEIPRDGRDPSGAGGFAEQFRSMLGKSARTHAQVQGGQR